MFEATLTEKTGEYSSDSENQMMHDAISTSTVFSEPAMYLQLCWRQMHEQRFWNAWFKNILFLSFHLLKSYYRKDLSDSRLATLK